MRPVCLAKMSMGIEKAKEKVIWTILVDLAQYGFETIKELKSNEITKDIPVILCTGYNQKISDETASEIGINAFARKPSAKADLAGTVRKVLDEAKS